MWRKIKKKSELLYRIELQFLKIIPFLIACIYFLNVILSYFNIDVVILNYLGGLSLLPLLFLYLSSYVFKFCKYHRIPLHYIVANNIINIIDCYWEIPYNDFNFLMFHLLLVGVVLTIIIYLYVKNHKNTFIKDCRQH